jgi:hypothetical protein
MIYKAVMLWLIISEALVIIALMKETTMQEKIEAFFLICGFFLIGILVGVAI